MFPHPDLFRTTLAGLRMVAEAQAVIAYRLSGMAGLWSVSGSENNRMVSEKAPALIEAQSAAIGAALRGQRPDQVYAAWLKPIGRRTRANARRLGKRGPRRIG